MVKVDEISYESKRKLLNFEILSNASYNQINKLRTKALSYFGKYQLMVIILMAANSLIAAVSTVGMAFRTFYPQNYTCIDEDFGVCIF